MVNFFKKRKISQIYSMKKKIQNFPKFFDKKKNTRTWWSHKLKLKPILYTNFLRDYFFCKFQVLGLLVSMQIQQFGFVFHSMDPCFNVCYGLVVLSSSSRAALGAGLLKSDDDLLTTHGSIPPAFECILLMILNLRLRGHVLMILNMRLRYPK